MESAMKMGLSEEGDTGSPQGEYKEEGDSGLSDTQTRTDKWFKSQSRWHPVLKIPGYTGAVTSGQD